MSQQGRTLRFNNAVLWIQQLLPIYNDKAIIGQGGNIVGIGRREPKNLPNYLLKVNGKVELGNIQTYQKF